MGVPQDEHRARELFKSAAVGEPPVVTPIESRKSADGFGRSFFFS